MFKKLLRPFPSVLEAPAPKPSTILAEMIVAEMLSTNEGISVREWAGSVRTGKILVEWTYEMRGGVKHRTREMVMLNIAYPNIDFSNEERNLIKTGVENMIKRFHLSKEAKAEFDNQQKAADALAKWVGVEA